jgi:hypothetical protein
MLKTECDQMIYVPSQHIMKYFIHRRNAQSLNAQGEIDILYGTVHLK